MFRPEVKTDELLTLAKLFEVEERAEEFVALKNEIKQLTQDRIEEIPEEEKKKGLALNTGAPEDNFGVFTSAVGEGYALTKAGAMDLSEELEWDGTSNSTTVSVSAEYIVEQNPDFVTINNSFIGGYEVEDTEELEELYEGALNSSLKQTTVSEEENIYIFQTNLIGSDKQYIGQLFLAKMLYPDYFDDVDPEQIYQTYFEEWLEIPPNGIWMYPSISQEQ